MICVVVPAFNEEGRIGAVIRAAKPFCDAVVVCDDGSEDQTAREAEDAGAVVIRQAHGGYGAALNSLFRWASEKGCDCTVTLDGDGQHDPTDIPRVAFPVVSGAADICVGARNASGVPAYRRFGVRLLTRASGSNVTDGQSGFRAYGREAIDLLAPKEKGMSASAEILVKAKLFKMKVAEVPISIRYDEHSHSQNPARHGLDVVLGTLKQRAIQHPLVWFGIPGAALFVSAWMFFGAMLWLYGAQGHIAVSIELLAIALGLAGEMLMGFAFVLWVLISVVREK